MFLKKADRGLDRQSNGYRVTYELCKYLGYLCTYVCRNQNDLYSHCVGPHSLDRVSMFFYFCDFMCPCVLYNNCIMDTACLHEFTVQNVPVTNY